MIGIARLALLTTTCAIALGVLAATAEEAAAPQFVGAAACGTCHKRATTGNQFKQWQESGHAQAYATLGTEAAASVAAKAGIEGSPQEAPECLRCHVTAYGVDASLIATPRAGKKGFQASDGVQCESCHGPGSLYKSRKVMKSRKAALAVGLVIPNEAGCVTCHNEQSPSFEGFDFEEMYKKIQHPNPKKAAAAAASE